MRLRGIRRRLAECEKFIAQGVLGLRSFHIDQLPPHVKGGAARAVKEATDFAEKVSEAIDNLLREHARSPLIDEDPAMQERSRERATSLKGISVLYEGTWRAPRKPKS